MGHVAQQDRAAVRAAVREFVVNNFLFGANGDSFTDQDSFLNKGIMDSTGILELIEFLEERYGIKIEDEEMLPENLDSLDNVSAFVTRKAGNGASS